MDISLQANFHSECFWHSNSVRTPQRRSFVASLKLFAPEHVHQGGEG